MLDTGDAQRHWQRYKGAHGVAQWGERFGMVLPNFSLQGLLQEAMSHRLLLLEPATLLLRTRSSLLLAVVRLRHRGEAVILLLHALQERCTAARAAPPLEHA